MQERYTQVERLEGYNSQSGPKSLILAGVHGNEKPGIIAYKQLQGRIHIENGLVLLGYGNPKGIVAGERFSPGGADLNRMFKPDSDLTPQQLASYEYQRAQELKVLMRQVDAMLDVHGTRNSQATPFLIAEPNGAEIVAVLPFKKVVSGFDEFEPGGTDYYMNRIGKIGICAESGYNEDPESIKRAQEAILEFLKVRGHITGKDIERIQTFYRLFYIHITEVNFKRAKTFADFEQVSKDQVLGTDGDKEVKPDRDGIVLFANRDVEEKDQEVFVLAQKTPQLA